MQKSNAILDNSAILKEFKNKNRYLKKYILLAKSGGFAKDDFLYKKWISAILNSEFSNITVRNHYI
jgi:phosphoribosylformylglycinamidine (FGAM) synthase-like amidotransferase family enzyme